jgi:hypothetical protein
MAALCCGCADATSDRPPAGKAIHLDDQQRIVLSPAGTGRFVCGEPSPDALAAYAAAIGGDVAITGQDAGSPESAAADAGSIGLRTQSITLMRDALYRICEAYESGQFSESQARTLMARLQDLAADASALEQQSILQLRVLEEQIEDDAGEPVARFGPSRGQRADE